MFLSTGTHQEPETENAAQASGGACFKRLYSELSFRTSSDKSLKAPRRLSARLPDSDYSESLLMPEPMITQHNYPALTQVTKAPRQLSGNAAHQESADVPHLLSTFACETHRYAGHRQEFSDGAASARERSVPLTAAQE